MGKCAKKTRIGFIKAAGNSGTYTIKMLELNRMKTLNINTGTMDMVSEISRLGKSINGIVYHPYPIMVEYTNPMDMVNTSSAKNPFYSLLCALKVIYHGKNTAPLDWCKYQDADIADYGYRMRGGSIDRFNDTILELAKKSQPTISDIPMSKVSDIIEVPNLGISFRYIDDRLSLTVFNTKCNILRNENPVIFGTLLQLVANKTGIPIGSLYIAYNNIYAEEEQLRDFIGFDAYCGNHTPVRELQANEFICDCNTLFSRRLWLTEIKSDKLFKSQFFKNLVVPILNAAVEFRKKNFEGAVNHAAKIPAYDWKYAVITYIEDTLKNE